MISCIIGTNKCVGIISDGANHLKGSFLENVGVDESISIAIDGLDDSDPGARPPVRKGGGAK
jgi:hypothetical protein